MINAREERKKSGAHDAHTKSLIDVPRPEDERRESGNHLHNSVRLDQTRNLTDRSGEQPLHVE